MSQEFKPMGEQLSLKAAMPLAEILATCRKNVSNTGPSSAKMFPVGGVIMIGGILLSYYSNITWVSWRLTSSTSRLFVQLLDQVVNKENIEVRKYWAFALKTASNSESVSISWRQYDLLTWFGYWIIFTSMFQLILMPLHKYNMVSIRIC